MSNRHNHLDATAVALMIACCASWGVNQVAIKIADEGISPILQAGLRGSVAAALVLLWSLARRVPLFRRDGSLWVGSVLGLLFAAEFMLLYWGINATTASRSIIFMYLAPFVVAIGAHLWIPGERLGVSQVAGLLAAFAGMLVAFRDSLSLPSATEIVGDVLVVGAAVLWGATTVLIKASRLAAIPPNKTLLYQLAGSALLVPLSWALGEPGITAPTPAVIGALAYSTIGVAFISYVAWFWLIAHYPAAKLSGFSFLAPLIGVLAGGLFLGETITPALWLALALVALGITLINRRSRKAVGDRIVEGRKAA